MRVSSLNTFDPIQKDLERLLIIVDGFILRRHFPNDHSVIKDLSKEAREMIDKYTKRTGLTMEQALGHLRERVRIRRECWPVGHVLERSAGATSCGEIVVWYVPTPSPQGPGSHRWSPSLNDLQAKDWLLT